LSRTFTANLYNNGLSPDGALAVCQTCNARSNDSSVLAIFDLQAETEISACQHPCDWAQSYEFASDKKSVALTYPTGERYIFGLDGSFWNRDVWTNNQLRKGNWFVGESVIDQAEGILPTNVRDLIVEGIGVELARPNNLPQNLARCHRVLGKLHDQAGDSLAALAQFDLALALDPKVGIKRRADQLRKKLQS
jgi:hypothetical protein